MLFEQIHYRSRVANIQVVMFVVAKVRDQVAARFFRGGFGTKKISAHVVVDPKDMRAVSREAPHRFRANQSRRTCNDDRAHHDEFTVALRGAGTRLTQVDSPLSFRKGERIEVRSSQGRHPNEEKPSPYPLP